jgi:hypothetical protein
LVSSSPEEAPFHWNWGAHEAGDSCLNVFLGLVGAWLQGCTGHVPGGQAETAKVAANSAERNCLTVVMNRVASPLYPKTICGVVGEPHQFAPGVLTRALNKKELPLVEQAADAVLKGERYAPVGDATHFHVAGLRIPYRVHYVALAGGNAFYKKEGRHFSHVRPWGERSTTEIAEAPRVGKVSQAAVTGVPRPSLRRSPVRTRPPGDSAKFTHVAAHLTYPACFPSSLLADHGVIEGVTEESRRYRSLRED